MKAFTLILALALFPTAQSSFSQDTPPALPETPAKAKAPPTQEELETIFKETLSNATLAGRWCLVTEGKLGPEKEDRYQVIGVSKIGGDTWMIRANIEYNGKSLTAPVPVKVKWAGDTPVITLDKIPVPGSGVYSARVLIFDNTYAGTWSGGNFGGLMSGLIQKTTQPAKPAGPGEAEKKN